MPPPQSAGQPLHPIYPHKRRRELYDQQDDIDARRGGLIAEIEGQLKTEHGLETIFTIQWDMS